MELKYIVLFLIIYALSGSFASSLLKKWKLQVQPHGGHVADKNSSSESRKQFGLISRPNSLTPSNEKVTPEKSKTIAAPTTGPSLSAEEKRKLRLKKKRRQLKKRMRSFQSALKEKSQPLRKCKGSADCEPSECCIRYGRRGFCKKRPQKGHRCKPMLKPGLEECPCQTGLTCTHFKTNRHGYRKYRCEVLRQNEDEREQP